MEACGFCSEPHLGALVDTAVVGQPTILEGEGKPCPFGDDDDYVVNDEPAVLEGEGEPSPLASELLGLPMTQVVHLEEAQRRSNHQGSITSLTSTQSCCYHHFVGLTYGVIITPTA